MQSCSVIVPVIRRPQNAGPFMESFLATAYDATVYAVADPDDKITQEAWYNAGATVLVSDRGRSFANKAQYGYLHTDEDWLLLVGDDVKFHRGWLRNAMRAGIGYDLVSTNDCYRQDLVHLAVHPMIRREYVDTYGASWDGPGYIVHEGYHHWFVDREWSLVAQIRMRYTYAPKAMIEHMHPLWGKGVNDEIYEFGQARAEQDKALFERRLSLFAPELLSGS